MRISNLNSKPRQAQTMPQLNTISKNIILPEGVPSNWKAIVAKVSSDYGFSTEPVLIDRTRIHIQSTPRPILFTTNTEITGQWDIFTTQLGKELKEQKTKAPSTISANQKLLAVMALGIITGATSHLIFNGDPVSRIRNFPEPTKIITLISVATALAGSVLAFSTLLRKVVAVEYRQDEFIGRLGITDASTPKEKAYATTGVLELRKTRMRDDLTWFRRRSGWLSLLGSSFLLFGLIPPVLALHSIINGSQLSLSMASYIPSAIALASAALLFRYESRIRDQYQAASGEIAYLDKAQLALECALAVSKDEYEKALQQVVKELLRSPPLVTYSSQTVLPSPQAAIDAAVEQGGPTGAFIAMAERTLEKTIDGVTAVATTKKPSVP
ncbi:hypothetical protein HRD49_03700 [Corallococcus exiguus]|uniref:hypothetical protein n=1 Tax=Corallococcus exiguus TaxID=83462 RepID=UPI00155FB074|nr:hypothetical protein [Corallococcus exiguus]NRD60844.1 hypothetical protein [Corallococcus exiguus]